jgi:hypothetical protein
VFPFQVPLKDAVDRVPSTSMMEAACPMPCPLRSLKAAFADCSACLFPGSGIRVPISPGVLHFLQYTRHPGDIHIEQDGLPLMTGTPGGVFPPGRRFRILETRNMGSG